MLVSSVVLHALYTQINVELNAAYNYLNISNAFMRLNYMGCAHWTRKQFYEEIEHAEKIMKFIDDLDLPIELRELHAPVSMDDYKTPLELFNCALVLEQSNTVAVSDLYKLAQEHNEFATAEMLRWFINEQVEEEAQLFDIIDDINNLQGDKAGLLILDRELGQRD